MDFCFISIRKKDEANMCEEFGRTVFHFKNLLKYDGYRKLQIINVHFNGFSQNEYAL